MHHQAEPQILWVWVAFDECFHPKVLRAVPRRYVPVLNEPLANLGHTEYVPLNVRKRRNNSAFTDTSAPRLLVSEAPCTDFSTRWLNVS